MYVFDADMLAAVWPQGISRPFVEFTTLTLEVVDDVRPSGNLFCSERQDLFSL